MGKIGQVHHTNINAHKSQCHTRTQCVRSGLRVMRLNFSHATYEEATLRITNLRK